MLKHSVISLLIALPFVLLVYIPLLPAYIEIIQNAGDPYYEPTLLEDFSPLMILVWGITILVLSFIMQVLNISVYGHFLKILKNTDLQTNEEVGGYFTIAKNNFGKIILLSLASSGIALLATLLCYFPVFYVIVPLNLVIPIFVFNPEMSNSDIIKAAFKLGNKYWLIIFGLIFVGGILSSLGMILCYVGLIATVFFSWIVSYHIYKDSIGFGENQSSSIVEQLDN